jgi:hypothetical protein
MNVDQIRDALTRQPFEPFDLRLVDGRSFTIHHTDYLAVPPVKRPRNVVVFTPRSEDPDEEYRSHYIDLNLIVELTVPTATAQAPAGP